VDSGDADNDEVANALSAVHLAGLHVVGLRAARRGRFRALPLRQHRRPVRASGA